MALVLNGTTGVSKVQDGIVTSASIADATIQPIDLAQNMTLMTAQTASGTSIDFTGIPSWAKRITVMLNGISTNGVSNPIIQLGSSVGIDNTGYLSTSSAFGASVTTIQNTNGFVIYTASASSISHGHISICSMSGNSFICSGTLIRSEGANSTLVGGSKTLSSTLDRIRITTVNGTDVFDAGTINIMYEG